MARRAAKLTESMQQLGDVSIAQAQGLANIQVVLPGTQDFDSNTDLVLTFLSVPATVRLPKVAAAVNSYVYTARNLGTANLTFTTAVGDLIDRSTTSLVVAPGASATFTAILRADGVQEWITISPADVGDPIGTTTVNVAADFGIAVGGVITLLPDHVYHINAFIDLGTDVLEGHNITLIGNSSAQSLVVTNSSSALISSDADGFITLLGFFCSNPKGPFINFSLGSTPGSFTFMDFVFFSGDPANDNTGVGTIGKIDGADRISWNACFFVGIADGLIIDGTIGEAVIGSSPFIARGGAPAFTGIKILSTATTDIFSLNGVRFATDSATDRAINFSPSATYTSPIRLRACTIRGPGTFIDAASLQKSDPSLIATDNQGATAPSDSLFTATATFKGNADLTVIATQGVQVRIGNGTTDHTLFNGGSFVERFTLSGTQTQLQELTYNGERTRTFSIGFNCQLTRVGGGTVTVELAIQVNNVTVADSETETEVGNSSSPGLTRTTVGLNPGDDIQVVIANQSGTADLIVKSATWTVRHLN